MPDAFALLELPRRPWLAPETVRAAFQRRAAATHPDAGGDPAAFAELAWAHETLRTPAARLRHLLADATAPPALPPALLELFPRVAHTVRAATRAEEVEALRQTVAAEVARADDELRALDAAWPAADGLAALQARYAILEKWAAQLREARLRLEIG